MPRAILAIVFLLCFRAFVDADGCSQCCPRTFDCCCCQGSLRCGGDSGGCANGCFAFQRPAFNCQVVPCAPYSCPTPPPCNFCSQNSFSSNGASVCAGSPALPAPPAPPSGLPWYPSPPAPPAFPTLQDFNINSYGRSPPGDGNYVAPHPPSPPRRTRPPPASRLPLRLEPAPGRPSLPTTDEPFYENDKPIAIPALDDGETTASKPSRSTPPSPLVENTTEAEGAEMSIDAVVEGPTSTEAENPQNMASSPHEGYRNLDRRLRIDEEPSTIDLVEPATINLVEPPPPTNEELLNEVNDLLQQSKREAHLLSQLVEEITTMNSIAKATNGKSTRIQEGLPEVGGIDDVGPPAFEDIDIAEEFPGKKAQAARNYNTDPLVEKLEERLVIPIETVHIELSTVALSASSDSPPPTTPTSTMATTFAALSTRFHQSVNFTDLLGKEQTMVPPASTPLSGPIRVRSNTYSLNFAAKHLAENFMKAHEEMTKRVTAVGKLTKEWIMAKTTTKPLSKASKTAPQRTTSAPFTTTATKSSRTRSRTLEMLLQQIKENQEQKRAHAVMPVVKKLMRKFVKTKAAKTVARTKWTKPPRKEKLVSKTKPSTPVATTTKSTTTSTTTTTTTLAPPLESSVERPIYVDSDVDDGENLKLDGDTGSGAPQGAIVDSETVEGRQNPKLKGLANFQARKAFLEDIFNELGTREDDREASPLLSVPPMTTLSTASSSYHYVEDVYGDVRVVGGQSRTTRRPAGSDYLETSRETPKPVERTEGSESSRPVVRIRTTEFDRLDPRTVAGVKAMLGRREPESSRPFKVRVPSFRSKWDRRYMVERKSSTMQKVAMGLDNYSS
ncbi:hypothetical protein QR680_005610 [Steinernema hermaphroditum]|uniref:Uncharacterized protein n=1 Tax=Steinernema hermaphroditum TaxID=289476 RepID=A0AA39HUV8_9BILA|nr:hypothetical protein QR680_005610 [Steinernema hermaphroditum]